MTDDDRRSGLARVLAALAELTAKVESNQSELARLHDRIDGLERTVARAVAGALEEADVPTTADHVQSVVTTALSVLPAPQIDADLVTAAVQDAFARLPRPDVQVDLGPVLDAIRRHEPTVDLAPVRRAVEEGLSSVADRLAAARVDPDDLARRVLAELDAVALSTSGESEELGVELVRRTVAASHRALLGQLRELLEAVRADLLADRIGERQVDADVVDRIAHDLEAVRRAIERAGGLTR